MKYALALLFGLMAGPATAAVSMSIEGLVEAVIYLIVVGGVFWLLLFLIDYVGLLEPFAKVAKIVVMVVGVILLINLLLGFAGHPLFSFR